MQGSQTDFKNELLYRDFGINYSKLSAQFRKVLSNIFRNRFQSRCWGYCFECRDGCVNSCSMYTVQGSVVIRQREMVTVKREASQQEVTREVMIPVVLHVDIIGESFWNEHPSLLNRN